jgi:SecD/SecF fusion protein
VGEENSHVLALKSTQYDFLKYARPPVIASVVVVLIGIGALVHKGKEIYGIDFTGGDQVSPWPLKKSSISPRCAMWPPARACRISIWPTPSWWAAIREVLRFTTPFDQAQPVVQALQAAHPRPASRWRAVAHRSQRGQEIQSNAFWAIFWSLLLILGYVAFRFEFGYGVGAVSRRCTT